MLNMEALLESLYFDGSTFTDNKIKLGQAAGKTAEITLDTDNYVYTGYYKPFNQFYLDIPTPNTNASSVLLEYWDGTQWSTVASIDSTDDLTSSGLMQWEPLSDWATTAVDGTTKYWTRLSTDTLHSAASYNFIGLILADDNDLEIQVPYINESDLLGGETSHFKYHIAARDAIVQRITNRGYIKLSTGGVWTSMTAWDLLTISELRLAATNLALYYVYFNASDSPEDVFAFKAQKFMELYEMNVATARLTLDSDDDGVKDISETVARSNVVRMFK